MLLNEAGLLIAICNGLAEAHRFRPLRLTWHGHEFLAGIRETSTWEKVKKTVKEKAIGLTIGAISEAVKYHVANAFKAS